MSRLGLSCFLAVLAHISICACDIRKQFNTNFVLVLNPKYEKKIFFSYLGVLALGGGGGGRARLRLYVKPR